MNRFDPTQLRAPHLAGVEVYQPLAPVPFTPTTLKLDLNESPVPPSPRVCEVLAAAVREPALLNWYPDPTCASLRAAISRYVGLPPDHLMVTNGSNQAIEIIARAYLAPGRVARIVSPTYGVFKQECQLAGACVVEQFFANPFATTRAELLAPPEPAAVIFLANPNNPTGTGWTRADVAALVEQETNSLVVLDEAYAEFHDQPAVDLVGQFPNLVVLRSFSKAFALAGIRCGYIVAQPATLTPLRQVFPPWSVSALTQVAAEAALGDLDYMRQTVAECRLARQMIVAGLRSMGFEARDTAANFILWQVADPAGMRTRLAARQVYVSNKDTVPQLRGQLRVTVGTRAQAEQFLHVVREIGG